MKLRKMTACLAVVFCVSIAAPLTASASSDFASSCPKWISPSGPSSSPTSALVPWDEVIPGFDVEEGSLCIQLTPEATRGQVDAFFEERGWTCSWTWWNEQSGDKVLGADIGPDQSLKDALDSAESSAIVKFAVLNGGPYFDRFVETAPIYRHAGDTAVLTSVEVSREAFEGTCDAVIVATATDYKDALAAAGFAGALDCPILLAYNADPSDEESMKRWAWPVSAEINRLDARTVYVAGGPSALSDQVVACIMEGLTHEASAVRVDGSSLEGYEGMAIDTALDFALRTCVLTDSPDAIVVSQNTFTDATSISPFAYAMATPIIPVTWDENPDERRIDPRFLETLQRVCEEGGTIYVTGGTAAVPSSAAEDLFGESVLRLAGDTGFDTSFAIAEYLIDSGRFAKTSPFIATGCPQGNGVDAITACALAARESRVLLLAGYEQGSVNHTQALDNFAEKYGSQIGCFHLLGGTSAIPRDYEKYIHEIMSTYWEDRLWPC